MERLTIPDKKIPGGVRRAIIDTRAVSGGLIMDYGYYNMDCMDGIRELPIQ